MIITKNTEIHARKLVIEGNVTIKCEANLNIKELQV